MRSRQFYFIIIFLIIVLSILFILYNPYVSDNTPQTGNQSMLSAIELDELIQQTIRITESVERYYQDTELDYEYSELNNGIQNNQSLNMVMTARVDVNNKTLWAAINSTFNENNIPVDIKVEMYSTGDDLYIDMQTEGESPGWIRSKQIITSWNKLVSFENVLTVLKEETVLNSRNEVHNGNNCYVLAIPVKNIYTIYRTLKNSYSLENEFRYTFELVQSFSDYFIFEVWIEKDSFFIVKTIVSMDVEVTPDRVTGMKADSARYLLNVTTANYKMNQDFIIELPEELDDAPLIYTINE